MTGRQPIYKTWVKRLEGNAFTASQAAQWAHAVVPISEGVRPRGAKTNLTNQEARDLRWYAQAHGGVGVDEETAHHGLIWLQRNGARCIGMPANVIDTFSHFTFTSDAHLEYDRDGDVAQAFPIWKIHTTDGRQVAYWRAPWQARAWTPGEPGGWWEETPASPGFIDEHTSSSSTCPRRF